MENKEVKPLPKPILPAAVGNVHYGLVERTETTEIKLQFTAKLEGPIDTFLSTELPRHQALIANMLATARAKTAGHTTKLSETSGPLSISVEVVVSAIV